MVAPTSKTKLAPNPGNNKFPPFKYSTVSIGEIVKDNYRVDASFFDVEGLQARREIENCKFPVTYLCGENCLATSYHRPRFRRVYVEKSDFPIYQPAQINELYPKPSAYISDLTQTDIDSLRVRKGQILLTCSGTVGNCTYVRNTFNNLIFSHDLIRIEPREYGGYIYAFIRSQTGSALIKTNNYGAVVSHIEPDHLNNIPIPDPPRSLKLEIHNLIEESFRLRDESNDLIDDAQTLLKQSLKLPDFEELRAEGRQVDTLINFSVQLGELNNRLDGSYHLPTVLAIERHLEIHAQEVTTIGDNRISLSVILPGRFRRIYVEEGNGIPFFSGKKLLELDPSNKKYLSLARHEDRIRNQLTLHENMTMITRSGTIGKVTIAPKHWERWTANEHIIRVVPANNSIAGYLYAWLSSDYAYPLIARHTFGAVVDEIDDKQVSEIKMPLCYDENVRRQINSIVLHANNKRAEAYELEHEALALLNEKVFYAQ